MKRTFLRALTSSDIDKTLEWRNQDDIVYFYSGHPFPVNIEMERQWFESVLRTNLPTTVFGIVYKEEQALIGLSILKNINMINRSCEFAIFIGDKKYRGLGLSKEATVDTLNFGFEKLGLNRISLRVLQDNKTAITLYEKSGFVKEGLLRESIFKDGSYKSELLFSILKSEYMHS